MPTYVVRSKVWGPLPVELKAWIVSQGIDAAFNYRQVGDLVSELGTLCPDGIDLYYDNVGGQQLDAALSQMRRFGRIVLCGSISQYNAKEPQPGPGNLRLAVGKRLTLRGFIVSDHSDRQAAFREDMARWIAEDKIVWRETVVEGIENAPKAFIGLLRGDKVGKMLVKL